MEINLSQSDKEIKFDNPSEIVKRRENYIALIIHYQQKYKIANKIEKRNKVVIHFKRRKVI